MCAWMCVGAWVRGCMRGFMQVAQPYPQNYGVPSASYPQQGMCAQQGGLYPQQEIGMMDPQIMTAQGVMVHGAMAQQVV